MRHTGELWRRARLGDSHARSRLIEQHMPLARSLAVQYRHAREPLEDLCQVANVGLVKAVDRYDPARGIAFTSFAVPTILGELKRHFRDRTWTIHVSRGTQEAIARVEKVSEGMRQQLGRYPSVNEVAHATGMSVEEVTEARLAAGASRLASLDAPITARDDAGDMGLADTLGRDDDGPRPGGERALARAAQRHAHGAPARGAAPAVRRGPGPARDRRARRPLADARVADPPRHARAATRDAA